MNNKINKPILIALGALLVILVISVFSPLYIGVADNGDFYRSISSVGVYFLNPANSHFFVPTFGLTPDAGLRLPYYATSHTLLIDGAVWLNKLLYSGTYFDIRFLSLLYSLILMFSAYMAFKAIKLENEKINWLYYAVSIFMIADISYLAYFNSFYGEAATYATLLLAIASYIYTLHFDGKKFWSAIVFYIAMIFFIGSKQQNCILAIPAAILAFRFSGLFKDEAKRLISAFLAMVILASGTAVFMFVSPEIKDVNIHQSVFIGVLKYSNDVKGDLKSLGLDAEKLSPLAGTTYYDSKGKFDPKGDFMKNEFFSKITYDTIIRYYVTHPIRFIEKMEFTAQNAFGIVQGYLGNYPEARGNKPSQTIVSPWDFIKQRTLPHTFWFIALFELGCIYFAIKEYKKANRKGAKLFIELQIFLILIGLMQFVMPYIADGEGDISKHLFIFNLVFDIQLVTAIAWGTDTLLKRRKEIQDKFGVKQ